MLLDKRQHIGRSTLDLWFNGTYQSINDAGESVLYPWVTSSFPLTGENPSAMGTPVSAFSWIFVTKSVYESVLESEKEVQIWRWFKIPLRPDIIPLVGQVRGGIAAAVLQVPSNIPRITSRGGTDVDLFAVAT